MRNRALLSAVAVCFAAAGCDSKKPAEPAAQKPATAAVVPVQPATPANPDGKAVTLADAPKAGGAAPAKGNGRRGCTRGNCKVEVDVTGGKPCAKATPDRLDIFKGNQGDDIHWRVNTAKWKFTSDGIEWKDSAQQQFKGKGHEGGDQKTYKWNDANTDDKEYKYIIHLVKDDGTKCDVDPSAINGADEQAQ